MKSKHLTLLCISSACLAACSPSLRSPPVSASAAPAASSVPAPQIQRGEGLESVIGESTMSLTRRFGRARIDLSEGDARKLQFISQNCVLDIFFYPLERGSTPVATHVEARQRKGGGDADRAGCIEEVERSVAGG